MPGSRRLEMDWGSACGRAAVRAGSFLRRVAGMPDYQAYLEHCLRAHPRKPIPSEREFYAEYLRSRYGDGPTRCC